MKTPQVRFSVLNTALVGIFLLLANIVLWWIFSLQGAGMAQDSPGELREIASRLASTGVRGEAVRYYSRYLDHPAVSLTSRAQVGLVHARLLKEEGRQEEALGILYRVELWAPGSEAARDAAPLIIEILDRLGLAQAAQTALKSRSVLGERDRPPADPADPVVARIGQKSVTSADLDRSIAELPPEVQERLKDPAQRASYLNDFVAREMLYQKAVQRSLDKDPVVRQQVDSASRQILIGRLLEEEVRTRVKADESDLRTFFEANRSRFSGVDGKSVTFEEVSEQVKQAWLMAKVQTVSQELLAQAQAAQEIELFPQRLSPADARSNGTAP